jgi:Predicted phosphoribosyltransferases
LKTDFLQRLPLELRRFVYTGIRDTYTWKGSEPAILARLAEKVRQDYDPQILVAAAHGAIMPALLLAELLDKPLYFIRFSMFKRHDEEPIISFSDKAWLAGFSTSRAILYDEDVAGGRTLTLFAQRLASLFSEARTACSIRHAGSSIRPDYVGLTWWD